MPIYLKLGEVPAQAHIKLPREPAAASKAKAPHYEHVVTTAGFDCAYSIPYHLRPADAHEELRPPAAINCRRPRGSAAASSSQDI